jgi:hypothetical protein
MWVMIMIQVLLPIREEETFDGDMENKNEKQL